MRRMTDLADNPIYKRMIQGSRGPSLLVCSLIAMGITVTGNTFWFFRSVLGRAVVSWFDLLGFLAMLMFPLYFVCVALILMARMVARDITNEDFALVRISGLGEGDIVHGYIQGARYRFRLQIAVGLGLLATYLSPSIFWGISTGTVFSEILVRVLPTILVVGMALLIYHVVLWPFSLTAGLWAALRSPNNALALAAALLMAPVIYLCVVGYCIFVFFFRWVDFITTSDLAWLFVIIVFTVLVIPYWLRTILTNHCVVLVRNM